MADKEKIVDLPPRPQSVPAWLYTEEVDVCGGLFERCCKGPPHKAAFLWWCNFFAMFFHLVLAFASVIVSTLNGKTMATPRLSLYLSNLSWYPNATDALVPEYTRIEGLYLAHMVLWFFLLSALAHGTVIIFNYRQAWGEDLDNPDEAEKRKKITRWFGWYYLWIHECRNPLR